MYVLQLQWRFSEIIREKYTVKNIAGSQDSYYFNSLFWPMKFHLLSSLSLTVELAEDQAARKEGGQETI